MRGFNNFERVQALASSFIQITDKSTELSNKLKLVTDDEIQHAQAMSAVYDISMKTAQSTQAVSAIYSSFSQNAKELGINQQQVASVTETISKAVAISGASASEAQNALTQFSQTLLMGKMRAQEYNSIMTQTPAVMQAIARGLGVTMGELKHMSDDGKLTSDKMIQALEKSKASVDELYGKTATTVSNAMQNLTTATEKFIGEVDKTTGVSSLAAAGINTLAQNLNNLIPLLLYAGTAFAGMKLQVFTAQTWQLVNAKVQDVKTTAEQAQKILFKTQARSQEVAQELRATQAYIANLQAQMNLARTEQQRSIIARELHIQTQRETALVQQQTLAIKALETAQNQANIAKRAGLGLLNAFGGPWGIAMGLVSAGVMVLYNWHQEAEQAREKALAYADAIEQVRANLEKMSAVQVAAEMVKVKQSIHEQEEAVAKLKEEYKNLEAEAQSAVNIADSMATGFVTYKTAEEMAKANDELALKTAELEEAENKLNKTLEWQRDLKAHEPVAELKEQFSALFPQVEQSQIKVDGLNVSIGNLTVTLPQATIEALKFAGAIGSIATGAIQAAVAVANLNNVSGGQLGETAQKMIRLNQIEGELSAAKKGNDKKRIAELEVERAELSGRYKDLQGKDLEAVKASDFEKYQRQAQEGFSKGSKKGKTKSSEDYRNDWDKYYDDLVNANASAWEKIKYEQDVAFRELGKHLSHGVVNQAEAEKARALIAEQYGKQRMELAGQYIPEIAYREKIKTQLKDLEQLEKDGTLTTEQAARARQNLGAKYVPVVAVMEEYRQKLAEIAELEQRGIINNSQANEARADAEYEKWKGTADKSNPMNGIRQGWEEWAKTAGNTMEQVANITTQAFDGMADQLTNFVMTGKADFRSLTVSILSDISKMIIKMMILNAVKAAFGGFSGGGLVGGTEVNGNATYGMGTWATGGYTGDGGKYTPAGIVHRGEYVITKEATARLGKGYLDYLNYGTRGFASGGGVAVPNVPMPNVSSSGASSNQVSININIDQNGNTESQTDTTEQAKQLGKTIEAKVLEVLVKQRRAGGILS
ncbi:phage tail tape measure protein [Haemophilus paraphrohaemolyticus]|uniref:Phage tail tape measure protein n=1 Tax=Haemophilus paraphrohaemolyticus TaxID=736 RepID=A0A369ZSQ6_9PAST|nr:phage tail tape measure protein [Haemophilus paraphrohaemolyticus]RDF11281.1 phage tail tape measure protein [Haemophilus paraphrohaemolyticus]